MVSATVVVVELLALPAASVAVTVNDDPAVCAEESVIL